MMWVCRCQLSECFTSLFTEDLCFSLTQCCTGLRGDHALTCASLLCVVIRWRKWGGSRSCETKPAAACIDPWAEDATFLFAGWKSLRCPSSPPLTFPVFPLVLPARPLDSRFCNPLTKEQIVCLATKPRSHEIEYSFPLFGWSTKTRILPPYKIPSTQEDCAGACSWCAQGETHRELFFNSSKRNPQLIWCFPCCFKAQ